MTENLGKLAPLVIFFVIWLFGAIAKAAQKGKKGTEEESAKGQEKHEPGFDGYGKENQGTVRPGPKRGRQGGPAGGK